MILPGATVGVLGGGQLGRLFAFAALAMGYRVVVLDPDPESPAGRIATRHLQADYRDPQALAEMARACAAVTIEFENVPADSLRTLAAKGVVVRPGADSVAVAQDRAAEKRFLAAHGIPVAPFAVIESEADLEGAATVTGFPALLKLTRLGYDGKGQRRVDDLAEARAAFAAFGARPCVQERLLPLAKELSVVLARDARGRLAVYPVAENWHRRGILDVSLVPAPVSAAQAEAARELAIAVAEALDYHGVLAVEFFLLEDGRLLVNEIAPRPHNSGHYTLDACLTSQFEQQLRVLCDLPLGDPRLLSPAAMVNLLGELWSPGEPDWAAILAEPTVKLHLYGKRVPRPGRKMGHLTCLADTPQAALAQAMALRRALGIDSGERAPPEIGGAPPREPAAETRRPEGARPGAQGP